MVASAKDGIASDGQSRSQVAVPAIARAGRGARAGGDVDGVGASSQGAWTSWTTAGGVRVASREVGRRVHVSVRA